MMGGVAFLLLKDGRSGRETAKQAEIRLASLRKILHIGRFGGVKAAGKRRQGHAMVVSARISAGYG
jgi:hypothetical protein